MLLEDPYADATRPVRDEGIAIAVLLAIALLPMPYGYYQFMRWAVCILALYFASQVKRPLLAMGAVLTAALFNPLLPVRLSRADWQPIDCFLGIAFLVAAFAVRAAPRIVETEELTEGSLNGQ